jgi:rRNA maturation protein Rpf1
MIVYEQESGSSSEPNNYCSCEINDSKRLKEHVLIGSITRYRIQPTKHRNDLFTIISFDDKHRAMAKTEAAKRRKLSDGGHPVETTGTTKDDLKSNRSTPMVSDGRYHNKQRCLVLCSRGVTARHRHLLEDLRTLMPHHKKESKLEAGKDGIAQAVNDICELRGCNTVLFLECRKRQDAYMWIGNAGGPSARFHVSNIHTMDEMKLTGNCMKHSRPILSFDESFGRLDHLKLLKTLLVDVFGTPRGHPKSKPFVDRVMGFYYADNRVSARCFGNFYDETFARGCSR